MKYARPVGNGREIGKGEGYRRPLAEAIADRWCLWVVPVHPETGRVVPEARLSGI
jgi:hypothetical protein